MKESKKYSKDFLLVVIGQIISLFGNQILRFALPLYLLNQTGSAALFGLVSAVSFIPMIVLCPIGGIIADRINKRNIMVTLDFSTAAITLILFLLLGKVDIVILLFVTLIFLYGIQGTYQPAVQASLPVLVKPEQLIQANAMINLVSSLASLIGPVIGGALFAFCGIRPILSIGFVCFLASAIMEIFIKIPFSRKESDGTIFSIGFQDMKESFNFIRHIQPSIWKVSLIIACINLFLSSLIIIGLPVIVTQFLDFSTNTSNRLYGYAQGALAAGSLTGGIIAGVCSKKLKSNQSPFILLLCTVTLIPIGLSLSFHLPAMTSYIIIVISCFFMMLLASLFSIQMMAYLQMLTPPSLIGKVISCAICIGMCAQPLGQAMYGGLFELLKDTPAIPFYGATLITCIVCIVSRKVFDGMDELFSSAT